MENSLHDMFLGVGTYLDEVADPRIKVYPMMGSPTPFMMLIVIYLFFALKMGPAYMKNREPYRIKKIIISYNAYQIAINIILFVAGGYAGWFGKYSYVCQPVDTSDNPEALLAVKYCYLFVLTRLVDYLDTVFFVLTKKFSYISSLHLTHHILTSVFSWYGSRVTPGGHGTFVGFINSFVHVVMYTYYLLAALGPQYKKFLWWKKYLTVVQLVQFVLVIIHESAALIVGCDYPKQVNIGILIINIIMVLMFSNFYYWTYSRPAKKAAVLEKESSVSNGHIAERNWNLAAQEEVRLRRAPKES